MQLKIAEHAKEKLEEELKNKHKELAMATMNVAQKNEKLIEIKERLLELENLPDRERRKVENLIRMLDDEINDESYWEQFEQHFNALNDDFLNKLKKEHPDITHKDLKMCAFLRMNLSNKEIASLLNITLRGVEASRLRLRKKLNLPKDMPLNEYILRF
jgi:DNA-binding CsgD family transcriptional regulator